jgi:hypothetical protein
VKRSAFGIDAWILSQVSLVDERETFNVSLCQWDVLPASLAASHVRPGSAARTTLALGNEGVCDHLHFRCPFLLSCDQSTR